MGVLAGDWALASMWLTVSFGRVGFDVPWKCPGGVRVSVTGAVWARDELWVRSVHRQYEAYRWEHGWGGEAGTSLEQRWGVM